MKGKPKEHEMGGIQREKELSKADVAAQKKLKEQQKQYNKDKGIVLYHLRGNVGGQFRKIMDINPKQGRESYTKSDIVGCMAEIVSSHSKIVELKDKYKRLYGTDKPDGDLVIATYQAEILHDLLMDYYNKLDKASQLTTEFAAIQKIAATFNGNSTMSVQEIDEAIKLLEITTEFSPGRKEGVMKILGQFKTIIENKVKKDQEDVFKEANTLYSAIANAQSEEELIKLNDDVQQLAQKLGALHKQNNSDLTVLMELNKINTIAPMLKSFSYAKSLGEIPAMQETNAATFTAIKATAAVYSTPGQTMDFTKIDDAIRQLDKASTLNLENAPQATNHAKEAAKSVGILMGIVLVIWAVVAFFLNAPTVSTHSAKTATQSHTEIAEQMLQIKSDLTKWKNEQIEPVEVSKDNNPGIGNSN